MKKEKKGGRQRKNRKAKSPRESAVDQLRLLLRRYPKDGLDIEGIILDYLGQSNTTLDKVFDINHVICICLPSRSKCSGGDERGPRAKDLGGKGTSR